MSKKKRLTIPKLPDTQKLGLESEGKLWLISTKIRGVGELIKQQDPSSLFTNEGAYGLGSILTELADDIEHVTATK